MYEVNYKGVSKGKYIGKSRNTVNMVLERVFPCPELTSSIKISLYSH